MNRNLHTLFFTGVLLLSGCDLPGSGEVIDQRTPPVILDASFTPTKIDLGKIQPPGPMHTFTMNGFMHVTDNDGLNTVSSITYTIYSPSGKVVASGPLYDNGVLPDLVTGDGKFNTDFPVTIPSDVYGVYSIQYSAVDNDGYSSTKHFLPLNVITMNHAPVASDFIAPDTIVVPSSETGLITVSVQVTDQEGLSDIKIVRMTIVDPSNNSIRSIVRLYDDGGTTNVPEFNLPSGDSKAGDGRFTLVIPVPSNTTRNMNRDFNVFAIDQSDESSNIITKRVRFQ